MEERRKSLNILEDNSTPTPGETEIIPLKKGVWRTYDATDGLPGRAFCLLHDRKGYLWIATDVGLCRYDGTEFITYTVADGLVDNRVHTLCEDDEGRLWVGTAGYRFPKEKGGGISCFDGQRFTSYTTADGLADNQIHAICIGRQGKLWIGTNSGLSCFHKGGFTNYTTENGLVHDIVLSLCEDSQARVWLGTLDGLSCFDGQHFTNYTTADGLPSAQIPSICEDNQGQLWLGSEGTGKGASCFDGKQFTTYTYDDGLVDRQNFVRTICKDQQGKMWFGTWAGVSCFDGSQFINYTPEDGLWAGGVLDIIEDREGQMWFAHGRLCGLSCYDAQTVSFLTSDAGWTSTQDKKGRLWSGGLNVYGIRLDSESSEIEQQQLSFTMGGIHLMVDSKDRLWIAPYQDGVYRYDSSDVAWETAGSKELPGLCHFRVSDNLDPGYVMPLLEMKDGTIWFSFPRLSSLYRFEPQQLPDGKPLESIDTKSNVRCMIEDSQGKLWMGGASSLSCWDGSELITYTQENGLPSGSIISLLEDDSGRIWIGTTHGLCCFDGEQFIIYGEKYDLRDLYHWCAVKDASGQLWFATRGGIYRTDGKHFQWLTDEDGLPSNRVTGLLPQSDGSMIISAAQGTVHYQPNATLAPRIEIGEVVADKVYRHPKTLELTTTGANLITVSYHSVSLATRRMRYSYILEGYDKDWRETWQRQARYENLPTGEYTFRVIAINRDLVTSETPATLKLKVVPDPKDVGITIMRSELNHLRQKVGAKYDFHDIIGQSEAIKEVKMRMELAIDSNLEVVVLITGETGTGKELVANAIHFKSSRKDQPKLSSNCAAIPRELGASTLFGHRKGGFTGAEDQIGLFEAAKGGTLILDEIGDMPLDVQVGLLRVLEERRFHRVGEFDFHDVDVRIIAITNRNLEKEVEAGRFRQDIFYRLNEFPIHVPPLRERLEDVPSLAEHFLTRYFERNGTEIDGFAPGVLEMLQSYHWPGNVRQLEHVINTATFVAQGECIETYHFPASIAQGESLIQETIAADVGGRSRYRERVNEFERRCIEHALQACGGNKSQAAKMLDIERKYLYEKIKRLKIDLPPKR